MFNLTFLQILWKNGTIAPFLLSLFKKFVILQFQTHHTLTMDLFETINEGIKNAMKARDRVRLEALKGIKKEFLEAKTAPGAGGELPDDKAMAILVKMAKQRKETAQIYIDNNRPDLAEGELNELAVIEDFLPKALSADELEAELKAIIAEVGATSAKEMGKVMGVASKRLAGRADGKAISAKVRELLA